MITNLTFRSHIKKVVFAILSTLMLMKLQAQDYTKPPVTEKWEDYRKQVRLDSNKKMIELKSAIPRIVYDLRYASTNNFMNRLMYPSGTQQTYLRLPAINALKKVQQELEVMGYGLKIFDAYRPFSVTVKFWELVRDERYVANPSKGSGHNRGIAVDLTIIQLNTGKELDMGTGFDNFSDTAHHDYKRLPEDVLKNRQLLRSVMEKHGFKIFESEWWHYFIPGSDKYEILDIEFKKLAKPIN